MEDPASIDVRNAVGNWGKNECKNVSCHFEHHSEHIDNCWPFDSSNFNYLLRLSFLRLAMDRVQQLQAGQSHASPDFEFFFNGDSPNLLNLNHDKSSILIKMMMFFSI